MTDRVMQVAGDEERTTAVDALNFEDVSTGNALIDGEHRALLRRLSDLERAVNSRCSREIVCQFLADFCELAVRHFEHEEELMAELGYPGLEEHRAEHLALTRELERFGDNFANDGRLSYGRVLGFLSDWVADHLMNADRGYLPYLRQQSPLD